MAQVAKRFRFAWIEMKRTEALKSSAIRTIEGAEYLTDPLLLGNLFDSAWCSSKLQKNCLNTQLLMYYVDNGYGNDSKALKKVMLNSASRGDISGMYFMISNNLCLLDDEEICTMAGASGQLEALKWLRGDGSKNGQYLIDGSPVICPWDPTDVHREAAENARDDVLEYVEKNCEDHQIQTSYGVGLPW